MTSAATILRTGLKELGTNWSWNWRLTVLKTIKMTLVGSLLTNFKMTVRTVSICSPLPLSIKAPVHWLSVGVAGARKRVHLWTGVCPPLLQLPASKIKQTFYQTCLFTGFWSTSSQTPLLATRGRKGENDSVLSVINVLFYSNHKMPEMTCPPYTISKEKNFFNRWFLPEAALMSAWFIDKMHFELFRNLVPGHIKLDPRSLR